jgi:hypothetical protein
MLRCIMLKTLLTDHGLIWLLTNNCFVCSNTYSLHANCYGKNALSLWNVNVNFSYTKIGRKTLYWEILTFCGVWVVKTKRRSTGKALTGWGNFLPGKRIFIVGVWKLETPFVGRKLHLGEGIACNWCAKWVQRGPVEVLTYLENRRANCNVFILCVVCLMLFSGPNI